MKPAFVIAIFLSLFNSVLCTGQTLLRKWSTTFYTNVQLDYFPAERGFFTPTNVEKAHSYRLGFEGNRSLNERLDFTAGLYYTKDYFQYSFRDSLYDFNTGETRAITGVFTQNFNLLETPVGLEYRLVDRRPLELLANFSLIAGWNMGSRQYTVYDDDPSVVWRSRLPAARVPVPNSLRVLLGLGVGYRLSSSWKLLLQPNYILGLERLFDMPPSNLYVILPPRAGSWRLFNVRAGIRKTF